MIASLDILAYPSSYESFGIAYIEAGHWRNQLLVAGMALSLMSLMPAATGY